MTGRPAVQPGASLLVTGGAGFIGSCYVRDVLARRDGTRITVLDKLTYAGNLANLEPVRSDPEQAARLAFVRGDICDRNAVRPLVRSADAVLNFAAETHVDRSLMDSGRFLRTGVLGVGVLIEAVREETARAAAGDRDRAPRFVQVSTDEVYGPIDHGRSGEDDPLAPTSPYAAAKAAGELLAQASFRTSGIDLVITRGSNTYGPYQHPEKLIPLLVTNAIDGRPLPIYGDGRQRRDWLHVTDHAAAIDHLLRHGRSGGVYNIPGGVELANLEVAELILRRLGLPRSLLRLVRDRDGHDRRCAMDGARLHDLGWSNRVAFDRGIAETIDWYRANQPWWRPIRRGAFATFYRRQYAQRLAEGAGVP